MYITAVHVVLKVIGRTDEKVPVLATAVSQVQALGAASSALVLEMVLKGTSNSLHLSCSVTVTTGGLHSMCKQFAAKSHDDLLQTHSATNAVGSNADVLADLQEAIRPKSQLTPELRHTLELVRLSSEPLSSKSSSSYWLAVAGHLKGGGLVPGGNAVPDQRPGSKDVKDNNCNVPIFSWAKVFDKIDNEEEKGNNNWSFREDSMDKTLGRALRLL